MLLARTRGPKGGGLRDSTSIGEERQSRAANKDTGTPRGRIEISHID